MTTDTIKLDELSISQGFRIQGATPGEQSGVSVSSAGDVNGDGIDDVVIGANRYSMNETDAGAAYVLFGSENGFPPIVELSSLDGEDGFRIEGLSEDDQFGRSVSGAGDLNGDGIDDFIVGAPEADANGLFSGEAYVVFGQRRFEADLDLGDLDGSNGFHMEGVSNSDLAGFSVSDAGDVNGDGIADVIVGAYRANGNANPSGEAYVVFGSREGFAPSFDLGDLDGSNGFAMQGVAFRDQTGVAVSTAGDVNGDGFEDIIVGANLVDDAATDAGAAYVVYGSGAAFPASLNLSGLDSDEGFRILGDASGDNLGRSVSGAGDVNGDGFDDLIVGAFRADAGGNSDSGESYVIFGSAESSRDDVDVGSLDGSDGFALPGIDADDQSGLEVAGAGDLNGDGFDDLVIGAWMADPNGNSSGEVYVVYGRATGFGASFDLSTLDGTNGFTLEGYQGNGLAGFSVSAAGDVNGDGFDDAMIGAYGVDVPAGTDAGESYVIFGQAPTTAVTRVGSDASQTIRGGAFNDRLEGRGGDDTLIGAGGGDQLLGGTGDDTLIGGAGGDTLIGGAGTDTADYSASVGGITLDLGSGTGTGGDAAGDQLSGIEIVVGSRRADRIDGSDEVETVRGGAGDDVIETGAGADRIEGGSGDDEIDGGRGSDRIDTGSGNDQIKGGRGTDTIMAGSGNDRVQGQQSADMIEGMSGADVIVAGSGSDTVFAGSGADRISGGSGQEMIVGGSGKDRVTAGSGSDEIRGGSGDDVIDGNSGNDTIIGGSGDDVIEGGSGRDRIQGNSGDDRLDGNADNDRLAGGSGADVFEFGRGGGRDIIEDFEDDVDRIELFGFGRDRGAVFDDARQDGRDVVFDFGRGGTLIVENTSLGAVSDDVFLV